MTRWIVAAMVAAILASSVAGLASTRPGRVANPAINSDGMVTEVTVTAERPAVGIPTVPVRGTYDIAAPDGRVNSY
jgi:hypothetical protein